MYQICKDEKHMYVNTSGVNHPGINIFRILRSRLNIKINISNTLLICDVERKVVIKPLTCIKNGSKLNFSMVKILSIT